MALGVGIVVMLACMGYAGSRTPIVIFPAGVAFFVMLRPTKPILFISAIFFTFGTLAMMKSSSNPVLHRIQSSFRPSEDASMQLRIENQRMIQPFIRKHPLGTGLGTTGVWGRRFVPDFWGAYFAHDSGLVRIAMEAGYIGLVLYLIFLGTILISGIRSYFRCRDHTIKTLILGIVIVMFCLTVASYPQEAIPMLPTSLVFYVLLACMVRLDFLDRQLRLQAEAADEAGRLQVLRKQPPASGGATSLAAQVPREHTPQRKSVSAAATASAKTQPAAATLAASTASTYDRLSASAKTVPAAASTASTHNRLSASAKTSLASSGPAEPASATPEAEALPSSPRETREPTSPTEAAARARLEAWRARRNEPRA